MGEGRRLGGIFDALAAQGPLSLNLVGSSTIHTLQHAAGGDWPAAGSVDTEIGCFMKWEVADAAKKVWA